MKMHRRLRKGHLARRLPRQLRFEGLERRELFAADFSVAPDNRIAFHDIAGARTDLAAEGEDRGIVQPLVAGPTVNFDYLKQRFGEAAARTALLSVGRVDVTGMPRDTTCSSTGAAYGSGTVLALGGRQYVLTAAHVVEDYLGRQVKPSQVKFKLYSIEGGLGTSEERVVDVEFIWGRATFNGRDLALMRLHEKLPAEYGADLAAPGTPTIHQNVLLVGFGYPYVNSRSAGISPIDGVGKFSDAGTASCNPNKFQAEHLTFVRNAGEAAVAKGDSGGPDYLISNGRPQIVGVHSFFSPVVADESAPRLGATNWSVQITPEVVERIQFLMPASPPTPLVQPLYLQFGIRVLKNGEDGFFCGHGGEWRMTLTVNGSQKGLSRNNVVNGGEYWFTESQLPVTTGQSLSYSFDGKEIDFSSESPFCVGDEKIPRVEGTFVVKGVDEGSLKSARGETSYELLARVRTTDGRHGVNPGDGGTPAPAGPTKKLAAVSGRFNADQNDDIFLAEYPSGENSLIPQGETSFLPELDKPIDPRAINGEFDHVVARDFNGDGHGDLLFHASRSGNNRWFFGRSDGTFDYVSVLIPLTAINGEFDHLVSGDFDGDGRSDLLFHATASGNNRWYFGRADRGFDQHLEIIGRPGINGEFDKLAVGDFNHDGRDDVLFHASASGNNRWAFMREDRGVDFDSNPRIAPELVNAVFDQVVTGDFNADGRDDLLFYDADTGFNRWFLATASGEYAVADEAIDADELAPFRLVVAGDFDGDGRTGVTFFDAEGIGARRFEHLDIQAHLLPQTNPLDPRGVNGNFAGTAAGDFDGDGFTDILFHDPHSGENKWAWGRPDGTFDYDPSERIGYKAINGEFNHVVAGDFNGDGRDDLLFHATASGNNRWYFGRPDRSFDQQLEIIDRRGVNGEFDHVVAGDFNGDGADDLLFHATSSGNNRWWFNSRDGVQQGLQVNLIGTATINSVFNQVVTGDFDGDGRDDLLFHVTQSGDNRWAFGRSDGRFDIYDDLQSPLIAQTAINHEYNRLAAGDLNGDGRDDLVFYATASGHTRRAFGRVDRQFDFDAEFHIQPGIITGADHLVAGDFNGDGAADLFFHRIQAGTTVVAYSDGPSLVTTKHEVFIGDFDGDGDPDAIYRNADQTRTVEIWQAGRLHHTVTLGAIDAGWRVLAVGDFDADGDDDLLLRHANGTWQTKIMQNGDWPAFKVPGDIDGRWEVAGVGDFDGDGDDDILFRFPDGKHHTLIFQGGVWVDFRDLGQIDTSWQVLAIGDFNGDGVDELLMRAGNGETRINWMSNGVWHDGTSYEHIPSGSAVTAAADCDRDGDDDLLLRAADGTFAVQLLQGGVYVRTIDLPSLDREWRFVAAGDLDLDGAVDLLMEHSADGRRNLSFGNAVLQVLSPLAVTNRPAQPQVGRAFQNSSLPTDVNADGVESPLDVLLVITQLNTTGSGALLFEQFADVWTYIDVNGDGQLSPHDALIVINRLNEPASAVGEGESFMPSFAPSSTQTAPDAARTKFDNVSVKPIRLTSPAIDPSSSRVLHALERNSEEDVSDQLPWQTAHDEVFQELGTATSHLSTALALWS